jgi:hypothetical protein
MSEAAATELNKRTFGLRPDNCFNPANWFRAEEYLFLRKSFMVIMSVEASNNHTTGKLALIQRLCIVLAK